MAQHLIELVNLYKNYGNQPALNNVNLYINRNEFVTLLGPSGCGKSTLLRLVAGFEEPSSGQILFNGKDIVSVPPHKRPFNTVFQRYALFSYLSIYDNVAFGLKIKKMDKDEIDRRVRDMLHLVNLDGYEKRSTDSLSGGQMQRVAMARALVNQPEVLLLDEPLAALDLKMRQDMQIELKNMQRALGITFLYVTHDQEEALAMSDTIMVMNEGRRLQVGTPEDIYNEPQTAFVADFIGESNIIDGVMLRDELVHFAGRDFVCVDSGFNENQPVDVVVRPEDIEVVAPEAGMLRGVVETVVFYGMHYEMTVRSGELTLLLQSIHMQPEGTEIGMNIGPESIHIMDKEVGA